LLINYKFLILLAALPGIMLIHLCRQQPRAFAFKKLILWSGVFIVILLMAYTGLVWYFPRIAQIFIIRINILYLTLTSCLQGKTYFPPGFWHWFHAELFKSFWLKYGWLKYELPLFVYLVLKIASLIALAGVGLFLGRWVLKKTKFSGTARGGIITLVFYAAVALGAYYLFWGLKGTNTTTQGRHLFIVMPAWAILFIFGWSRFFPSRYEKGVSNSLLASFAILNAISILCIIATYLQ
jgi:hypothetical protein